MLQYLTLLLIFNGVLASEKVKIAFREVEEEDFIRDLEVTFDHDEDFEQMITVESEGKYRRQALTSTCVDDLTAQVSHTNPQLGISNMTCVQFFLKTGSAFCAHQELAKYCCATRHRHCELCPDTPGVTVNGYTCDEFFQLTGQQSCSNIDLQKNCCGTRRRYCETCYQDTQGIQLGGKTCKETLDATADKGQLCDHHQIIQHCCASVAHYCPCKADVPGALFYHQKAKGQLANCASIFRTGNLADNCKHPNLWEKCCKTRMDFCEAPPSTGLFGRR